jgi:hypothetical protein
MHQTTSRVGSEGRQRLSWGAGAGAAPGGVRRTDFTRECDSRFLWTTYHGIMSDEMTDAAYRFLRAHTTGDLQFEEHVRPIKFVLSPEGRLAAPVMVAMLQAPETVLFVPQAIDGALELLVTLYEFDEHSPEGAIADRWCIHHGEPPDVRWAYLDIDAAKQGGSVIDGEVLMRPNPLIADESQVCKAMNSSPDVLRLLCLHHAHLEIESPRMVGLDPLGIDVRGRFDVVRVQLTDPIENADAALPLLMDMHARLEDEPHPAEAMPEPADAVGDGEGT